MLEAGITMKQKILDRAIGVAESNNKKIS